MRLNHGLRSLPLGLALGLAGLLQAAALAWPWPLGWTAGEPVAGLQVLSLAWLVLLLPGAPSARSAFLRGWLWATAWLAGTFWWLFISLHTYGGLPAPLALLGVLALAAALGLYYAGAAALFWRWRDARLGWRLTAFVALWTLAELARGLAHERVGSTMPRISSSRRGLAQAMTPSPFRGGPPRKSVTEPPATSMMATRGAQSQRAMGGSIMTSTRPVATSMLP